MRGKLDKLEGRRGRIQASRYGSTGIPPFSCGYTSRWLSGPSLVLSHNQFLIFPQRFPIFFLIFHFSLMVFVFTRCARVWSNFIVTFSCKLSEEIPQALLENLD